MGWIRFKFWKLINIDIFYHHHLIKAIGEENARFFLQKLTFAHF